MSALAAVSSRQLETIEQAYALRSAPGVLDVGCQDGTWVLKLRSLGIPATGVDDPLSTPASAEQREGILRTSVAANLAIPVHSCAVGLIRGTQVFQGESITPESTIALANVLSTLQPNGHLLVPVSSDNDAAVKLWQTRLAPFALQGTLRSLGGGLMSWLTLAALLRPGSDVTLLEFKLSATPLTRLDWHRLAREAVMSKKVSSPAAA